MDLLFAVLIGALGVAWYIVTGSVPEWLRLRLEKIRLRFQGQKAQKEKSYHVNFDVK